MKVAVLILCLPLLNITSKHVEPLNTLSSCATQNVNRHETPARPRARPGWAGPGHERKCGRRARPGQSAFRGQAGQTCRARLNIWTKAGRAGPGQACVDPCMHPCMDPCMDACMDPRMPGLARPDPPLSKCLAWPGKFDPPGP